MNKKQKVVLVILILSFIVVNNCFADIYSWTDKNGIRHFSNAPVTLDKNTEISFQNEMEAELLEKSDTKRTNRPHTNNKEIEKSEKIKSAKITPEGTYIPDELKNIDERVRSQWGNMNKEIDISGSAEFIEQVSKALNLLKEKAPSKYAIITKYIGRIEQGDKSGMWAKRNPPTYVIADKTTFSSITWCASTIAHDSYHSKLYHDYMAMNKRAVSDSVWKGEAAEKKMSRTPSRYTQGN